MARNPLRALRKLIRAKMPRAKRRTLIDLPAELIEMIGMKLIDHPTHDQLVIPQSTPNGRQAVYNTRLSCRFLRDAFVKVFMEIIHDIPYHCTEEGFRPLMRLLHVPEVSKDIKQITIGGANILDLEEQERQVAWITQNLTNTLRTILKLLPHLTSIRCIPVNTYKSDGEDVEIRRMVADRADGKGYHVSMVILTSIQSALNMTTYAAAVTSFTLRCSHGNDVDLEESLHGTNRSRVTIIPLLETPHYDLQHLTVDMECLQTFGVNANGHISLSNLATLTIILTRAEIDDEEMVGLDILASTQARQLTITGRVSISLNQVYSLVSPFTIRHQPPSHLILRETAIRLEHHRDDPNPPRPIYFYPSFRTGIFELQDVTWNRYVGQDPRPESQGWCETGWDVFPYLCELADVVRVRISLGGYEKDFLRRPDGALRIDGCSDLDEEEVGKEEGTGSSSIAGYDGST